MAAFSGRTNGALLLRENLSAASCDFYFVLSS
jgi:hypothetical protein